MTLRLGSISPFIRPCLFTGVLLLALGFTCSLFSQNESGIPFVRNFSPDEYGAHTQNFDIVEDEQGNIYTANFAGLLKFDGQEWELLTTPEISRVLKLGVDSKGTVFLGGLNEFGYLTTESNGTLRYEGLTKLIEDNASRTFGEIKALLVKDDVIYFFARKHVFIYKSGQLSRIVLNQAIQAVFNTPEGFLWQSDQNEFFLFNTDRLNSSTYAGLSKEWQLTAVAEQAGRLIAATAVHGLYELRDGVWTPFNTAYDEALKSERVTSLINLDGGKMAVATELNGLYIIDQQGQAVTRINRQLGLQNDQVSEVFTDSRNRLWLALNNGISMLSYPWPWTRYDISTGLKAGVVSVLRYQGRLFAGTYQGLYVLNENNKRFELFAGLDFATWAMTQRGGRLYAASSEGIYEINGTEVTQLTSEFALSLAFSNQNGDQLYAGTLTGLIAFDLNDRAITRISDELEQVTALTTDVRGDVWLTSIAGGIYQYRPDSEELVTIDSQHGLKAASGNRVFYIDEQLVASTRQGLSAFSNQSQKFEPMALTSESDETLWPSLMVAGRGNELWLTQGDETGISKYIKNQGKWTLQSLDAAPFPNFVCRAILAEEDGITWLGGPDGIIRLDARLMSALPTESVLRLSQVRIGNDSLYFGGHLTEQINLEEPRDWSFANRNLSFGLTTNGQEAAGQTLFSHRLIGNEESWSEWSASNRFDYNNLSPGQYELQARSLNPYGEQSELAPFVFSISHPWYTKWYAFVAYALLFAFLVREIVRWRSKKLLQEKEVLESTVAERTAEISSQRDEIQKQSEELSTALTNLEETQEELIRQERLASVGQLTKGIVDRVINPLNYINNFSQLSMELNDEIKELLDEEKEKIPAESFEELEEINGMMSDNLKLINTHGGSTTRMIKAMEEILKDRGGQRSEVDLNQLVVQSTNLVSHAYKSELEANAIQLTHDFKQEKLLVSASSEEIAKCIHQLMDNAVQAVVARCQKNKVENAAVRVTAATEGNNVYVEINDTGTGIPEKEVRQIFDPFFTTKTTAKGAGVGLYLVREIILSHKGKIDVNSTPNEGTTFKITLPQAKNDL